MAYDKDQQDFPLPAGKEPERKAENFLPKYFRTDTNKKFLQSTIDQFINEGVVEKLNSFVGRRSARARIPADTYLNDVSANRENYQFESTVVYKDELNNLDFFADYNDYLGQLTNFKGTTANQRVLNQQESYSWNPHIDWDKFSNFREYYWLPMGPQPIPVKGQSNKVVSTYTIQTVDDAGAVSYVLSPDGLTRNPTLNLYRGQAITFEINSPGFPIAFAKSRDFDDADPLLGVDQQNNSILYTDNIKKYILNDIGEYVETQDDYIEEGRIIFEPDNDTPDELYYINQRNINISGLVNVYQIEENSSIDVSKEIIGKRNYKTSDGVELSNGMKLYFLGNATPESYNSGYYYVEGVGDKIILVSESDLEVPAVFTNLEPVPFDNAEYGFDRFPFEDAASYPANKDYITINRASADRNPWSRYNRWFHKDVIETSARASNLDINLNQAQRAKRPIIEYNAGIKLYQHGHKAKQNVNIVDTYTKDVFSTIEGLEGYIIDGVTLADGMRVLFTADTDDLVKGKIYKVNFINFGTTETKKRQISLVEEPDGLPANGECILALEGTENAGQMYYYNDDAWFKSQKKTTINQSPLFDLFDNDTINFSDTINYTASSFAGNKLFSYAIGAGANDPELGFPLKYKNINNVGDIVFEFNLVKDQFTYQNSTQDQFTKTSDTGYLQIYNRSSDSFSYENGWTKTSNKQTVREGVVQVFENQTNNFDIDVYTDTTKDIFVKVYINGVRKQKTVDWNLTQGANNKIVTLVTPAKPGDLVVLKTYSSSSKNEKGYYEIPQNLESNPANSNVTDFTLGEVNSHVESIIENDSSFVGVYPGTSNLRDVASPTKYGTRFMQHSGPANLSIYHITDRTANVIKSIEFASREYSKFQQQFIKESELTGFHGSAEKHVDLILTRLNADKNTDFSFFASDMLGYKPSVTTSHKIEYDGEAFFALSTPFDLSTLTNKAVNVYLNSEHLVFGTDYIFENGFVKVTRSLVEDDEIIVVEYNNTNGSYIPPTPSKLGLLPKFVPVLFPYVTTNGTTVNMIRCHDGSLTKAYDDYRDELILELEYRIYNNIKTLYNADVLDYYDFFPGYSRNTNISKQEIDNILLKDFSNWLEKAGNPDYSDASFWDSSNSFTYNYSNSTDINGVPLQGSWYNIYQTYFDTTKPHLTPWAMLGYDIAPTWWYSVYGPAPYTRNNTILWNDLRDGVIREPGKSVIINKKLARPILNDVIPVNEFGQLISPLECGLAVNFVLLESKQSYVFGDQAPVERAWRESSEYNFALLKAWVLLQPAKLLGVGFDISRIERDIAGNIVYSATGKRIALPDLLYPNVNGEDNTTLTSGLVNYISNYVRFTKAGKYESYQTQLSGLKNQLGFKLGGFADKSKLKLVLDSRSPLNKTSVFVPDENYDIYLTTSSPQDTPALSGIIIEKVVNEKYLIKGYDKQNPVFTINRAIPKQSDTAITVGGVSETFITWNEEKTYSIGSIVEYSGAYYRTKITHVSTSDFDTTKFTKLAELPIVGGETAVLRKSFEEETTNIPYGTLFDSVQDVADFMLGYEYYLNSQGFVFESVNQETAQVEDMKLVLQEYLFWVTQNWSAGTVIAISPVASEVKFSRDYYSVDDLYDPFYETNILTGNGTALGPEFNNIFRDKDVDFTLRPIESDSGVYLIKLPLVQTEHLVLIDNETVFNDTIYDPTAGFRQDRIKVVGYRTDGWTGNLNIPGFVYDRAECRVWTPFTDYTIGDLVKYKEFYYSAFGKHTSGQIFDNKNWRRLAEKPTSQVLPNWDYKANQFADFYDLDTDNFDTEQQRLAQHLIGYQPREYLANIITDTVSQYKFYQGFIQEKGTANSLTKLFDPLSAADKDSVEFYEEWAIRLGQYGSIDNLREIEYKLDENKYKLEPQVFELTNSINQSRVDLVNEIPKSTVYKKPANYDHTIVPVLNDNTNYTRNAGYVKNDQVSYVITNWENILDINIDSLNVGENIWITQNESNTWATYKHVRSDLVVKSYAASTFSDIETVEIVADSYIKDIKVDDFVGVLAPELSGFAQVVDVNLNKLQLIGLPTPPAIDVDDSTDNPYANASITKFVNRRYNDTNDMATNITNIEKDNVDTIWLDNNGTGNWSVYENRSIYDLTRELGNPTSDLGFGESFDLNATNNVLAIGNPRTEKLQIYSRFAQKFNFSEIQDYGVSTDYHNAISDYGHSVAVSPDGNTVAVGAPLASNTTTRFKGPLVAGQAYIAGDIVSESGTLWKAKVDITSWEDAQGDSSTITSNDQDWEAVYFITAGEGTGSTLAQEGAVYIYTKDQVSGVFKISFVLTSPDPKANAKFGYTIKMAQTSYNSTKMFISAPGDDTGKIYFFEKLNGLDEQWKWLRDRNYKGIYSDTAKYNINDIVFYNNELYQALTNIAPGVAVPTDDTKWKSRTNPSTDGILGTDDDFIEFELEHTGYIPNRGQELDGEAIDVNDMSNFGLSFEINKFGDKLVAESYTSTNNKIVNVYNEINTRWSYIQQIQGADETTEFAMSYDINDDGDTIAISAPLADDKGIDSGSVYVYNQNITNLYVQSHVINSPFGENNEVFGTSVKFSDNKLAVVGKNTDIKNFTTFDLIDEDDVTVFDNSNTKFSTTITDSGSILIYQEIGDRFIFAEDLDYRRNLNGYSLNKFKFNNNQVFLSIPNYAPVAEEQPGQNGNYIVSDFQGVIAEISAGTNKDTWLPIAAQVDRPDIEKIEQVFLYNIDTQDITQKLDIIDPRIGKFAGPAEQEIAFKTPYDPATYTETDGLQDVNVDSGNNWTEKYVGQVWWNIDRASWYDIYQGDLNYRTANFNSLIPGYDIQVCEWVATDLTPSEWRAQSGTAEGYAAGVSGTPLYENTYSVRKKYDAVKKQFKLRYYYWVRNTELVPNVKFRSISSQAIAQLIADPASTGYRFAVLLANNKFALYNCKSLIEGTNTVIQFRTKKSQTNQANIHSEYQLISQGLDISIPNADIENKWHDSLVGYDSISNPVPDNLLPESQKYGVLNLPRQSMFINRLEAVKQFVDRANVVMKQNQIVDNYDISKLLEKDNAPLIGTGKYDVQVDTIDLLEFVGVAKTDPATISLQIDSGTITGVTITNSGRGYKSAPKIEIEDAYGAGAILNTTIDNLGKVISVDIRTGGKNYTQNAIAKIRKFSALVNVDTTLGGIWAIYEWNKTTQNWDKIVNQSFDTPKYWNYADWYAQGYNINTVIDFTIDQSYALYALDDNIGDIVKINSIGSGGWLLLKKVDNVDTEDYTVNYNTIGRQNGTIQLSDLIFNYSTETTGYDATVYDVTFYDREPVQELRNIISAIRNNLFIGDLAVEYNEMFFAALRYAHSEQSNIDWAFKTSFVRAKHNVGELTQKITYQNDNLENYQDYIEEVKPYKTSIREYISAYSRIEPTQSLIADFDLPPSYIGQSIKPSIAKYANESITQLYDDYAEQPYKSWVDNNKFDVLSIDVADGGSGYLETPAVTVSGDNPPIARAYLAKGKVKSIEIITSGQKYYKAPTVTITGQSTTPAKAVTTIGNGLVRSTHMVMRFDRTSGKRYIENINTVQTFTGSGAREKYSLIWPMDLKVGSFTVKVDGLTQLTSAFTVGNDVDFSIGYERFLGYINFIDVPSNGAVIEVTYQKSLSMLSAADRIFTAYAPTSGMPGINENNSLSSLMKGVEYEGVLYDTYSFGNEQGFGQGGFSDLPWDTFTNTFEDEVIILDGSTNRLQLAAPLEDGVVYNVYKNNIRIDDPQYDGSTVSTNTNAIMLPITGDGVIDYIDIDTDLIDTADGDVIIVRKSSSDGSFTPVGSTYDTSLAGGLLDYTTATGVGSGEIIIDGDEFRSQANSGGPEELVPGHVVDTLDMKVYHRATDGVGVISVANYWTDAETFVYDLPGQAADTDSIILILDGEILDSSLYSVDYENNTVNFDDSTSSIDVNLCIITIGVNGADLIDYNTLDYEINKNNILTLANFADAKTVVVFENGVMLQTGIDYEVISSGDGTDSSEGLTTNKAVIQLLKGESDKIAAGTKIQYMVYNNAIKSYSQIIIDKSFNADSSLTNYHKFTGNVPVPFNDLPISHKILVKSGDQILSPGYSVSYTTTSNRIYDIDAYQFDDVSNVDSVDVLVFVDNKVLDRKLWAWDNIDSKIRLLRNDVAPAGSELSVYFLDKADYYFVDTKITFAEEDSSVQTDLRDFISEGDIVRLKSNETSNVYEVTAETVEAKSLTIQSINKELLAEYQNNDEFIVSVNEADSTYLDISNVEYILSDNLTIDKEQILAIEVIQFSNHDINNFERYTLDVIKTTNVDSTSDEYVRRNLLSKGLIPLRGTIAGTNYAWVIKNGYVLSPNVDYIVNKDLNAVQLTTQPNDNDRIDILHFANTVTTPVFGYRIFRDMLGRTHYKCLNQANSYIVAADTNWYDYRMELESVEGIQIPDPSRNRPGIIWIDGERIEYFGISGNYITQLRRGTLGTGVKTIHEAGSVAYGQGYSESIRYEDTVETNLTIADGTSRIVDAEFTVSSINDVEVFVGGRKLRKNAISVFNPAIDQDSPAGDETIAAEFTIDNDGFITLATTPADGVQIKVIKKTGKTWTEPGIDIAQSETTIAKFLRGATIELPR